MPVFTTGGNGRSPLDFVEMEDVSVSPSKLVDPQSLIHSAQSWDLCSKYLENQESQPLLRSVLGRSWVQQVAALLHKATVLLSVLRASHLGPRLGPFGELVLSRPRGRSVHSPQVWGSLLPLKLLCSHQLCFIWWSIKLSPGILKDSQEPWGGEGPIGSTESLCHIKTRILRR